MTTKSGTASSASITRCRLVLNPIGRHQGPNAPHFKGINQPFLTPILAHDDANRQLSYYKPSFAAPGSCHSTTFNGIHQSLCRPVPLPNSQHTVFQSRTSVYPVVAPHFQVPTRSRCSPAIVRRRERGVWLLPSLLFAPSSLAEHPRRPTESFRLTYCTPCMPPTLYPSIHLRPSYTLFSSERPTGHSTWRRMGASQTMINSSTYFGRSSRGTERTCVAVIPLSTCQTTQQRLTPDRTVLSSAHLEASYTS